MNKKWGSILGEEVEITKKLMVDCWNDRVKAEVDVCFWGRDLHLEIKGDQEGILIGRHGRTLDSFQFLINRMVNKRLKRSEDRSRNINDYRKRKTEKPQEMAIRVGEKVKK